MMTPGQFAEEIAHLPGAEVRSVILYGSAAAGDHILKRSDYNILVLLEKLSPATLEAIAPLAQQWMQQGNPAPLLLTVEEMERSVDVFPIEWADIKDHHVLLIGKDMVKDLSVEKGALRSQLERELRTQLIALRSAYLQTARHPGKMLAAMERSGTAVLILLRSVLRLFDEKPPAKKIEALPRLAERLEFSPALIEVFSVIQAVKEGRRKLPRAEVAKWFRKYVEAVESITVVVDRFIERV